MDLVGLSQSVGWVSEDLPQALSRYQGELVSKTGWRTGTERHGKPDLADMRHGEASEGSFWKSLREKTSFHASSRARAGAHSPSLSLSENPNLRFVSFLTTMVEKSISKCNGYK